MRRVRGAEATVPAIGLGGAAALRQAQRPHPELVEGRFVEGRTLFWAVFAVMFALVLGLVPWRRGVLFEGASDPVVLAKAALGMLTFFAAAAVRLRCREPGTIGVRTLSIVALIVAVSSVGALAGGAPSADLVLSGRLVLVAATVTLLVSSAPHRLVLNALLAALGTVAVIAAVTGLAVGLDDGRLAGGLPEMAPNVLAGLAAPAAVGLAVDILRRGIRASNAAPFVALLAIVLATGSRTTLIVVVLAVALCFLMRRHVPATTAIAALACVPIVAGLTLATDAIAGLLSRGQSFAEIATLSQRTVAWDAVLSIPLDTWEKWIGSGFATRTIAVQQQWRDEQVLDSSWVSVLAQAGIVGLALLIVWVAGTVIGTVRGGRMRDTGMRALAAPLLLLLLVRSLTENGLVEAGTTFVLLLTVSLIVEPGSVHPRPPRPARYALAMHPIRG